MVQHRDEATVRAGRQYSKSLDSGTSNWRGLEDSWYERIIMVSLVPSRHGNDVMHAGNVHVLNQSIPGKRPLPGKRPPPRFWPS